MPNSITNVSLDQYNTIQFSSAYQTYHWNVMATKLTCLVFAWSMSSDHWLLKCELGEKFLCQMISLELTLVDPKCEVSWLWIPIRCYDPPLRLTAICYQAYVRRRKSFYAQKNEHGSKMMYTCSIQMRQIKVTWLWLQNQ